MSEPGTEADLSTLRIAPTEPSGNGDGKPKRQKKRRPRPASVLSEDGVPSILTDEGRTDLANARRLVAIHGNDLRFCGDWGRWLVWTGTHWAMNDLAADARAKDVARYVWRQLAVFGGEAANRALGEICRFARATAGAMGQRNLLRLAQSERGIPVRAEELDRDSWLFNVRNGTIDLRTGKLLPHNPADLITKVAPVAYRPDATAPTWERFLGGIFDARAELVGFMQRLAGYCLTGEVLEQILTFLYGLGANGKSTLLDALLSTWGNDYAMQAPPDLLMVRHGEQHPTERADLHGKRLVVAIETEDGRRLAESLVKSLTGGDRIRARRMREDFWEFKPTHKLLLACNHRPEIRGTDYGIWRRLRLVPFNVVFAEADQDKQLPAKLAAEREGILAWAVAGCLEWQRDGLGMPGDVAAATAAYRSEQDVLAAFLAERCQVNSYFNVRASALYAEYARWAEQAGEYALPQRRFGQALTERGHERYTNNGTWYRGIGLRDTTNEQ